MKTCPRCGAIAFDDADVCYGCLYGFTTQNQANTSGLADTSGQTDSNVQADTNGQADLHIHRGSNVQAGMNIRANSPSLSGADVSLSEAVEEQIPLMTSHTPVAKDTAPIDQEPPDFCIHLTPRHNAWGGWKWDCSVEIAEKIRHEVVGRHAVKVRS